MILRLDDGSELKIEQQKIVDFTLLQEISKMPGGDEIALQGIEPTMVREFFYLYDQISNGDNCAWFPEKMQTVGSGYARDMLSLSIYLGNEKIGEHLRRLLEDLFELPDALICHGFGL